MAENTSIKLRFADDFKSPTLEIGHGQYDRKFDVKEQPFEMKGYAVKEIGEDGKETGAETVIVTPEEEARILLGTGHFVEDGQEQGVKSKEPKRNLGKIGGAPARSEESAQS
jgi:hypothetical protein